MVSIFTKLSILYFSCCLADFLASFVSSALAFLEKTHLGKGEATYLVVSPVSSAIERTRVVFDPGGDPEKACPPQACCLARRCPPAAPLLLSTPPTSCLQGPQAAHESSSPRTVAPGQRTQTGLPALCGGSYPRPTTTPLLSPLIPAVCLKAGPLFLSLSVY